MNASEKNNKFIDMFARSSADWGIQCFTDLTPLINAWRLLDIEKHPRYAPMKKHILTQWDKLPQLHGKHSNVDILLEHQDFIVHLISLKFSIDQLTNPNSLCIAFAMSTMQPLWAGSLMGKLEMETNNYITTGQAVQKINMSHIIIKRIYGDRLDVSRVPVPNGDNFTDILSYQESPKTPKRYFRVRFDNELYASSGWSVQMDIDGDPPPLTQKELDQILEKPYDLKHMDSIIDMRCFQFNGVVLSWAEDITPYYQQSLVHQQLLRKDSLLFKKDLDTLRELLRDMIKIPDMDIGLILTPFAKDSKRSAWIPYLKSLRFQKACDPRLLEPHDPYIQACENLFILNNTEQSTEFTDLINEDFKSLFVLPLKLGEDLLGLIEFATPQNDVFDFNIISKLTQVSQTIANTIFRVQENEQERIMAIIKQTCTAIHPSVEWRFQEMAKNYLNKQAQGLFATPESIVFKRVIPFYGGSDIRSSSRKRNDSIREDLLYQLKLASTVIHTAQKFQPRPVFKELIFRIENHRNTILDSLRSGDETRIYTFLRDVVEPSFPELQEMDEEIKSAIGSYQDQIDPKVGVVYQKRKDYDSSVSMINDEIGAYLDIQQDQVQKILPHYFEKFKTDGVDYNMYVGDALLENGTCSPLQIRNLYLWQLMVTCGVVWLTKDVQNKLPVFLETAHLLLIQSTPLDISFHMEEKHFSVNGAYNARYEIVKKRIDKARILETGERLTQPNHIAIVYTQEHEAQMYREFISYLHSLGYLKEVFIDVLLEDLQGVHGLRALRVEVTDKPPKSWSKDSFPST